MSLYIVIDLKQPYRFVEGRFDLSSITHPCQQSVTFIVAKTYIRSTHRYHNGGHKVEKSIVFYSALLPVIQCGDFMPSVAA